MQGYGLERFQVYQSITGRERWFWFCDGSGFSWDSGILVGLRGASGWRAGPSHGKCASAVQAAYFQIPAHTIRLQMLKATAGRGRRQREQPLDPTP